jgi:hypothetical protein
MPCCAKGDDGFCCDQDSPIDGRWCPSRRSLYYVAGLCSPCLQTSVDLLDYRTLIRRPPARGQELNLRWRTFAGKMVQLACSLGAEIVVTDGRPAGRRTHTRPV